jgi:hypothetical protein
MKVIIFGATGMVGQSVLRESLLDDEISSLLTVGQSATGISSLKLNEIQQSDLLGYCSACIRSRRQVAQIFGTDQLRS